MVRARRNRTTNPLTSQTALDYKVIDSEQHGLAARLTFSKVDSQQGGIMASTSNVPGGRRDLDGEEPLDPAAMLRLSDRQQRSVHSQMGGLVPFITGTWAAAWLVGFLALWSIDGLEGAASLPLPLGIGAFAAVMVIALATSTWLGVRSSRGVRPGSASAFVGAVYGATWWAGSLGLVAVGGGLATQGLSAELANSYYPAAFVLFTGVMYMAAGAIWHAVPPVVMGVGIIVIGAASAFLPYPSHFLFLAVAGAGAFALLTVVSAVYLHRTVSVRDGVPGNRAAHA